MINFTKKGFRAFLAGLNPRKSVGNPELNDDCPLCRYIQSQGESSVCMMFDRRFLNVRYDGPHGTQSQGTMRLNPKWADNFQHAAIKQHRNAKRHGMTASAALKVLDTI